MHMRITTTKNIRTPYINAKNQWSYSDSFVCAICDSTTLQATSSDQPHPLDNLHNAVTAPIIIIII